MYRRIALSGLAALALVAAATANAATQEGFYIGAGFGQASTEDDVSGFDQDETGFKVFGGYTFNRYVGAEAAYFDGGEMSQNFGGGRSVDAQFTGLNFSLLGRLPLNDSFALFGKAGFATYDVDATARVNGTVIATSDDDEEEDLFFGVGAALSFGPFDVRAEYEAIEVEDGEFNIMSVSGVYRF
jgi:OOP family OmpA-OmpF porin